MPLLMPNKLLSLNNNRGQISINEQTKMTYIPNERFTWFLEQFGQPQKLKLVNDSIIEEYKKLG